MLRLQLTISDVGKATALACLLLFVIGLQSEAQAQTRYGQNSSSFPASSVWMAQRGEQGSREGNYRSKSDIMREVKSRYDARVLKIRLNEKRGVYNVRLLMPSGKVRNISISASR